MRSPTPLTTQSTYHDHADPNTMPAQHPHERPQTHIPVNGVLDTLKYYLRLLKTPSAFVTSYVSLVEKDPALKYEHKLAWDKIINSPNTSGFERSRENSISR